MYTTVYIPDESSLEFICDYLALNGYNIRFSPEHQEIDVLNDELAWVETILEAENIDYILT